MTLPEQELLLFESEKKRTVKAIQKKLASFTKAIKKAHDQLERSKEFEEVQHMAELVKANFTQLKRGMSKITVSDWKQDNAERSIALDPLATPKEQIEEMFRKSQKLKRALTPLEALIGKLATDMGYWKEKLQQAEAIGVLDELKHFQDEIHLFPKPTVKTKEAPAPYHHFHSESGYDIFVGKNASSNDALTFQVANGNDLWLHAHAMSGAHVVVRKKRGHDVPADTLEDALQLALYFSKARNDPKSSHEVLLTEKKYVSRLPRTPKGRVVVSKHKTYTVALDLTHIDRLKKSKT